MREVVVDGVRVLLCDEGEDDGPATCRKCRRPEDSVYHRHLCPRRDEPPPPPELGADLRTIEDVRRWLGHPSNQFDTLVFIVRWDGFVPRLRKMDAERLWEGSGLARAVIEEQLRRKRGLGPVDPPDRGPEE